MDARSLSKTEARVILSLEAEGRDLITLDEIRTRASVSPGFARKLAHGLVRKKWLQRVRRGTYLLNPSRHGPDAIPDTDPLRIGRRLVEPYFFGYATAAELLGLLPQVSRVYFIQTTSRWDPGEKSQVEFRPVRVTPGRFFGAQSMTRRGVTFRVSNIERTVLDCMNRPEFAGGMSGVSRILALAKPKLNWKRLGSYLDRFGNRSLTLRAGFLAERVRPSIPPPPEWLRRRRARGAEPYVPLGPPKVHGRSGRRDERWHLILNLPDSQLFAEGEIR
jgi:predicted transcriptional regulator of viral defense system